MRRQVLKGGRVHRLLRIGPPKSCQTIPSAAPVTRTPNSDPSTLSGRLSGVADYLGSYIKSIVRVTREVLHRDAKTGLWSSTSEVAYYVANSAVSACLAATAIRHHWNVENTLHYTRDVTFQEDQSRIRRNPAVFARLRSFAYNVLCRNRTSTFSQDRYAAALAGFNALANWCFS